MGASLLALAKSIYYVDSSFCCYIFRSNMDIDVSCSVLSLGTHRKTPMELCLNMT